MSCEIHDYRAHWSTEKTTTESPTNDTRDTDSSQRGFVKRANDVVIEGVNFLVFKFGNGAWHIKPDNLKTSGIRTIATEDEVHHALEVLNGKEPIKSKEKIPAGYLRLIFPSLYEQARFLYFLHDQVYKKDWRGPNVAEVYQNLLEATLREIWFLLGIKAVQEAVDGLEKKRTFKGLFSASYVIRKVTTQTVT